jgi:N-succinyldiaminopimelate aminotransferase
LNPQLADLQPYPFERLRILLAGVTPPPLPPIRLSIGEPQHATPGFILDALTAHLDGLATYPTTLGLEELREAMAEALARRHGLSALDARTQVLPVNGSREALFSFAQAVIDRAAVSGGEPVVVCPNPFYQIYEGAAILAGARPAFLNQTREHGFALDLSSITASDWARTQLVYLCTPGNPTGRTLRLDEWAQLFDYADRYGFVIASDECYGDLYPDEQRPPLGGLQAAMQLGRTDFRQLVVFVSLSKRSNAPGLRSGGVAGDASLLARYLLYRTYHGCAMSLAVQHASIAAWRDDAHVRDNRARYAAKFAALVPILSPVLDVSAPDAGFYLWARVPDGDGRRHAADAGVDAGAGFTRDLYGATHVTVLPGHFLARSAHGINPGAGYVRIALVPDLDDCVAAGRRIAAFCTSSRPTLA